MVATEQIIEKVGLVTGGVFCVGVALQLMLVVFTSMRRTVGEARKRSLDLELLRAQIESARRKGGEAVAEAKAWEGFRKFEVKRKVVEAKDMCSFYLVPHDKKKLPAFLPGQYLTFRLDIPGTSKQTIRCYSLSDGPRDDYYRVTIKKVPAPRDKPEIPPGLSSNHFHKNIKEGDILDVKAPHGGFYLDLSHNRPVVLIGGGIGITPVLSMVQAIIKSGTKRETHFFLGVRDRSEHAFKEVLEAIAREHDNIKLNICYSGPAATDTKGVDYHHAERVSVDLFKKVLPSNNYEFYICGPPPMMESLVPGLEGWGVPSDSVHFEAFGPASVKKATAPAVAADAAAAAATPSGGSCQVTFQRSGKSLSWDGKSSILEFAEANGIRMDSGCRAGSCGTCLTAVKSGKVKYPKATGVEPEAGSCLACIGLPDASAGPLVVDA